MKLGDRAPNWVGDRQIKCDRCGRIDDYKHYAPFVIATLEKWSWECDLCQFSRRLEGEHADDFTHGYAQSE